MYIVSTERLTQNDNSCCKSFCISKGQGNTSRLKFRIDADSAVATLTNNKIAAGMLTTVLMV